MGFHLRNSFQERIACLAIFQIYRSFICFMKHTRFMLFKKAKTGFLKIDHAVSVKLYFLEPIFRNCTGKNSIPFWTSHSSLGSNQTVLWTQSFSLNSLFTACSSGNSFGSSTIRTSTPLRSPFFRSRKANRFCWGNAILFYLSRRSPTMPRLPDTAAVSHPLDCTPFSFTR